MVAGENAADRRSLMPIARLEMMRNLGGMRIQGPKGGLHGALKFLLWSPEPYHFTDWSPDSFLAVEPELKHILRGARCPAFSILIIRVLDCIDS